MLKIASKEKDSTNANTPLFAPRQIDHFNQSNATERISAKIYRTRRKGKDGQKIS
jgi:hypothetical protein